MQVLKSLRQKQPIVLCLEDIQWLDELTLEFLQYVLRDPDPCPFLLCLTCRWSNMEASYRGELKILYTVMNWLGRLRFRLKNLSQEAIGVFSGVNAG